MSCHDDPARTARLLPWSTPEDKPCYLISDGTGSGYVSRIADNVESVQLDMADDLLDHAADILADRHVTAAQLRFLADRMAESLRAVSRVATSRGDRLPEPAYGSFDAPGARRD